MAEEMENEQKSWTAESGDSSSDSWAKSPSDFAEYYSYYDAYPPVKSYRYLKDETTAHENHSESSVSGSAWTDRFGYRRYLLVLEVYP